MPNPQYSPAAFVIDAAELLSERTGQSIAVDQAQMTTAFIAASGLLIALGVTPEVDPDDVSRAAEMVRDATLEAATHVKTKPRRAI